MTPAEIAKLLPHSGNMLLLDAVIEHDTDTIHCVARSHLATDNPLRIEGRLPAWCGIEYAAQAMAVHQGLCETKAGTPRRGFLALIRDVVLGETDLDGLPGDLHIYAQKIIAESSRSLYQFQLSSQGKTLLSGRVAVVLQGSVE